MKLNQQKINVNLNLSKINVTFLNSSKTAYASKNPENCYRRLKLTSGTIVKCLRVVEYKVLVA